MATFARHLLNKPIWTLKDFETARSDSVQLVHDCLEKLFLINL